MNYITDKLNCDEIIFQDEDIQQIKTNYCGYYVIFFLEQLNKDIPFEKILNQFDFNGSKKNVNILHNYFD